jgi:hypothetical protein
MRRPLYGGIQEGGDIPTDSDEYKDLAIHIEADVRHDFSAEDLAKIGLYSEGSTIQESEGRVVGGINKEDNIVAYFTNINSNKEYIENYIARLKSRMLFPVMDSTDTFQASQVTTLVPSGNSTVGIVQDAGKYITGFLGAKNVLTFGSVLDQAGKPVSDDKNPIWYDPGSSVYQEIDLDQFGFDPKVIKSITVSNFTGGEVSAVFTMADGTKIDAILRQPIKNEKHQLRSKPINNTFAEQSGYFVSIEKASDIKDDPNLFMYFMGKTLGDTMLVASCMKQFKNVGKLTQTRDEKTFIDYPYESNKNIYYPVSSSSSSSTIAAGSGSGSTRWKTYQNTSIQGPGPETLLLKTGDRLNHIRAFIKGVGTIYETRNPKDSKSETKFFDYIPGSISAEEIANGFPTAYANLAKDVESRYNILITKYGSFLDKYNVLKSDTKYSDFTGSNKSVLATGVGIPITKNCLINAGYVIRFIIENLEFLKVNAAKYFNDKTAIISANVDSIASEEQFETLVEELTREYSKDLEIATFISPTTIDPLVASGLYTHKDVYVISHGNAPFTDPINIELLSVFEFIKANGKRTLINLENIDETLKDAYQRTAFYRNFHAPIDALKGQDGIVIPEKEVTQTKDYAGITLEKIRKTNPAVVADNITEPQKENGAITSIAIDFLSNVLRKSVSYATHSMAVGIQRSKDFIFNSLGIRQSGGAIDTSGAGSGTGSSSSSSSGSSSSSSSSSSTSSSSTDTDTDVDNINYEGLYGNVTPYAINSEDELERFFTEINLGIEGKLDKYPSTSYRFTQKPITREEFPRTYTFMKYIESSGYSITASDLYCIRNIIKKTMDTILYVTDYTIAYELLSEISYLISSVKGYVTPTADSINKEDPTNLWKMINAYMCVVNHEIFAYGAEGESNFSIMKSKFLKELFYIPKPIQQPETVSPSRRDIIIQNRRRSVQGNPSSQRRDPITGNVKSPPQSPWSKNEAVRPGFGGSFRHRTRRQRNVKGSTPRSRNNT